MIRSVNGSVIQVDRESNLLVEFKQWLLEVHGLESEWQPERNCFKDFPAHLAYCAWISSRQELEIELPRVTYKQNPDPETDVEIRIRNEMRDQLDALGVGYK